MRVRISHVVCRVFRSNIMPQAPLRCAMSSKSASVDVDEVGCDGRVKRKLSRAAASYSIHTV